ncbi:MAG: PEP-CTERM sorting domain-containing protein [Brasilonema angustatum HA4187-MV1]|jgi:hypothetical protein|nr:PEP-CTERM sorting domain-containing protein [Brasilonema angustatum HA4187-MV1]
MKSIFVQVVAQVATGLTLCAVTTIASTDLAKAADFRFSWKGNAGYSASGSFSYDETTAPEVISESGAGPTNALQSLSLSVFNPNSELIVTNNEVVNSVSRNQFLAFNFDTKTRNFFGAFDFGTGSGAGDGFLSNVELPDGSFIFGGGSTYYLYQNIAGDYPQLLDASTNAVQVTAVPEPITVWGTLVAGILGVALHTNKAVFRLKFPKPKDEDKGFGGLNTLCKAVPED